MSNSKSDINPSTKYSSSEEEESGDGVGSPSTDEVLRAARQCSLFGSSSPLLSSGITPSCLSYPRAQSIPRSAVFPARPMACIYKPRRLVDSQLIYPFGKSTTMG
ncbi:uncharacterized protein L3040_003156 [Drepanopeziza brunnea f. sp. 'multigermtubi']|uniref:uncharacterized protein n=1 Tax=Drepanopeziza brunnea f. sp. 'multigermtubi' TaxID=698441 RepID=UPI0023835934|nr:hypothetical protein L3040_003156 [Drepanopeziza brunnea f. sp. 'multigermtubi']